MVKKICRNLSLIIFYTTINFFALHTDIYAQPTVISTTPENGATDVSPELEMVSIRFNVSMDSSYTSIYSNFPYDINGLSWSEDNTVLNLIRYPEELLSEGTTYLITLNNQNNQGFRDSQGNFLPETTFLFTVFRNIDNTLPQVISTTPADSATDASRDLQAVSIRFSEPMNPGYISIASSNFPAYTRSWTENNTVLNLTRNEVTSKLNTGTVYSFSLNTSSNENTYFRDKEGNLLPQTSFSFSVGEHEYELLSIEGNPAESFYWPYFLCIPKSLRKRTTLLVEPNNTGIVSDDESVHEEKALELVRFRAGFALDLDVPLLVPVFPRPEDPDLIHIYTHALDENTLMTTNQIDGKSIARLDLQLIAMIQDARDRLSDRGYNISQKIFMMGFSASGAFTNRFTAIHPGIIMASASGSPAGWPIAPVSTWEGIQYRYPIGISSLTTITGVPFDTDTFVKVPQYIYVGDQDTNDALDLRGFPEEDEIAICDLLNCDPNPLIFERWPVAEEIHSSVNSVAKFKIYPDIGHWISDQIYSDIMVFFKKHDKTRTGNSAIIQLLLDN